MGIRGKKILVTGADGFIGSHLVEKLVHIGWAEDQAEVVHVGRYRILGLGGPNVDDNLLGNPGRNEANLTLAEVVQSQYLHAQHVSIETDRALYVSGVDHQVVQSYDSHYILSCCDLPSDALVATLRSGHGLPHGDIPGYEYRDGVGSGFVETRFPVEEVVLPGKEM